MLDTFVLPTSAVSPGVEPPKPGIQVLESEDTYCKVALEPLRRGFGLTVGNPLRRILLSSTRGSAVTWVKIEDVVHEYATIPGVKEAVMDLLLNIKLIRIRSTSGRPGKMRLDVQGAAGPVCAGDIVASSDFEVVNPELHLATLDDAQTALSIEFNVEPGAGYKAAVPHENNPFPAGVLPVDAVFSPVRNVKYEVEPTRVGQITDYERLVLEVWSDGTIKPVEAVQQAADDLVSHFFLLSNLNRAAEAGIDRTPVSVSPEIYQTPIEKLELSPRTLNCLRRAHIGRVGEVLEMSDDDLLSIRNFGEKSLEELQEKLQAYGVSRPGAPAAAPVAVPSLNPAELAELMGDAPEIPPSIAPIGMTEELPGNVLSGGDTLTGPEEDAAGDFPADQEPADQEDED